MARSAASGQRFACVESETRDERPSFATGCSAAEGTIDDQRHPVTHATAIELRHLRYFLAVYEELHFGRAAERLHMAQPPLSQAIRKLEDELGVQLLHRTSRVVTATEAGRIFADEARKVFNALDRAVLEARRAGGLGAALPIGCIPSLPIDRLLRFLGALHERAPDIKTRVTHLPFLEQARLLRSGELDVGVFHGVEGTPDVEVEPLFAGERLAVLLPPSHTLAAQKSLSADDLRDETVVCFPRSANPSLYDGLLSRLEEAGFSFQGLREAGGSNERDLILGVADGLGVAVAPHSLVDVSEAGAIVIRRPLEPPLAMPDTVVAWRADPPRQLLSALEIVRNVAHDLRGRAAAA